MPAICGRASFPEHSSKTTRHSAPDELQRRNAVQMSRKLPSLLEFCSAANGKAGCATILALTLWRSEFIARLFALLPGGLHSPPPGSRLRSPNRRDERLAALRHGCCGHHVSAAGNAGPGLLDFLGLPEATALFLERSCAFNHSEDAEAAAGHGEGLPADLTGEIAG